MNLADHLPFIPVLLPLLAGILLLALRGAPLGVQRGASLLTTLALVPLAVALLAATADGTHFVYLLGDWEAPFGIILVADRLAAWMLLTTALLAAFALLYALNGTDTRGRHFHVLFQLQLFGLNGAFLTGDLFNLFVFFEVLLLASYGLLLHGGGDRLRVKAGLHYVVINLVGSTLFLFAVGTLYGATGTLNMADLAVRLAESPVGNTALVQSAAWLLFGVFALKAALVPLYLWLPAAYGQTSAPVAALFAIMTKVGVYSILRVYSLFTGLEGPLAGLLNAWLLPLALITLVIGIFGAAASTGLRQQTAYLVVASVGTLLVAAGLGTPEALAAGLYYLPHSTFATAALFLLADSIARARGETGDRFEAGPAIPRVAWLGGLFFAAAIAVSGLPPLSGFLAKFMLLQAAVDTPHAGWVLAVVLASGLLGVIVLARSGSLLFYRSQSGEGSGTSPGWAALAPAAGLLALTIVLTVAAGPASGLATDIAAQLSAPRQYIDAVLGAQPIDAAPGTHP